MMLITDALDLATAMAAIAKWIRDTSGLDQEHVWWPYYGKPRPTAPYIEVKFSSIRGVGHDWEIHEDNIQVFPTEVATAVSAVASTLTIPGHPFVTGDGPVRLATTGTLPAPLQPNTDYWIIVVNANTIQLAATYINTGGNNVARGMDPGIPNPITPITLTTTGTGTQSVSSTSETLRAGQEIVRIAQGFREVTLQLQCIGTEKSGIDAARILTNVIAGIQLHAYDLDQAGVGVSDIGSAFSQGGVMQIEGRRGSILEPRALAEVVTYMAMSLSIYETIIQTIEASINLVTPGGVALPPIPVTIKD